MGDYYANLTRITSHSSIKFQSSAIDRNDRSCRQDVTFEDESWSPNHRWIERTKQAFNTTQRCSLIGVLSKCRKIFIANFAPSYAPVVSPSLLFRDLRRCRLPGEDSPSIWRRRRENEFSRTSLSGSAPYLITHHADRNSYQTFNIPDIGIQISLIKD